MKCEKRQLLRNLLLAVVGQDTDRLADEQRVDVCAGYVRWRRRSDEKCEIINNTIATIHLLLISVVFTHARNYHTDSVHFAPPKKKTVNILHL